MYSFEETPFIAPTASCLAQHLGIWMIEDNFWRTALHVLASGMWRVSDAETKASMLLTTGKASYGPGGYIKSAGAGIIPIHGPMQKGYSKFGGTPTVVARHQIRQAVRDDEVHTIIPHFDTPGGTAAGTDDLARELILAREQKPVIGFLEDMCASAGYYVASVCTRLVANPSSLIGNIGTRTEVIDSSEYYEMHGMKVHVIDTGPYKSVGAPGQVVTQEHLDYLQQTIDSINANFVSTVSAGRDLTGEALDAVIDGRLFPAEEALHLGLIDSIGSFDDVLAKSSDRAFALQLIRSGLEE